MWSPPTSWGKGSGCVSGRIGDGLLCQKRVAGYSMGMKQKLLFAMAVLPKPKLLLLDEPHIGLDPTNIIQQREFLLNLQAEGVAILLSSHHLSEIEKLTNQVYFLKASKLIATEVELTADYDYHLAVENSKQVQEFYGIILNSCGKRQSRVWWKSSCLREIC